MALFNHLRASKFIRDMKNSRRASVCRIATSATCAIFLPLFSNERRLLPGTFVQLRLPSLWEAHKWLIIGLVMAVLLEAMLIASLLFLAARRRQAEAENLRLTHLTEEAHKQLGELVANVPGIVWETRSDYATGQRRTTFMSDHLQEMLGYTPEEWLKQPQDFGFQLMLEGDRERVRRDVDAVFDSGKDGFTEFRWTSKDGRIIWVESYLRPILDSHGMVEGVRGVTLDVSRRKQIEDALRQTEEKSSAIVAAIPDLIFIQTRDGVYLDYHAKNMADLFAPPEEFLGKRMCEVLPQAVAADFQRSFQLASNNHGPQVLEYKLPMSQGERWFEARIVRTGDNFLSVIHDITSRKMADEELCESEARFRNLADTAPVMIWISGSDKGRTYFNKGWLDFTGRNVEEELGNGWVEGVHPDDYSKWETFTTFFDDRKRFQTEYRLRRADGAYRWVFAIATPRFSLTGEFLGFIGTCVDITDRKETERALQEANVELEKLKNQLEAENIYLQEELRQDQAFGEIIGQSEKIKYVLYKVSQVAPIDATVLILGETGTGKELVARAIHGASPRKNRPLLRVNCAALSPTLIERG